MLQNEDKISSLVGLGLNRYEARVYTTLIEEGVSTAKNISDITGIPYGKIYEIINSLASKGFAITLPSKPIKCQAVSPKKAIRNAKKEIEEKFEKLEKHVDEELEPMFAESRKFVEPKGIFWMINGRANIAKKIDELIEKADKEICIHCSANSISRMVWHKELLKEAKARGVDIKIAGVISNDAVEELKSLDFCDIRRIKSSENNFISVDSKECLVVEPIPDDDNVVYGRDLGMWVNSPSFTKFIYNFYSSAFQKAKSVFSPNQK